MENRTESEKQKVIRETWINEDCNIVVNAVAGSGKTTTLLSLVEHCEYRALILSFNKSIQLEFTEKLEKRGLTQGKVMTLHSLGLLAIKNAYKYKMNNSKSFDIAKAVEQRRRSLFQGMEWKEKLSITYSLVDMNEISRLFLTDSIEEISEYALDMGKFLTSHPNIGEIWTEFVKIRNNYFTNRVLEIDFVDMLYVPVFKELYIPVEPTYLMIDEAQDLSILQHTLVERLIDQGDIEKWVAVGDRNQSIYAFSGAFSSSFDLFTEKENVRELPLDICYRCSIKVIEATNQVYNVMIPHSTKLGRVETISDPFLIQSGAMVVCRNTSPLVDLYFLLLSEGRKCYIKGEEILGSIKRFVRPYSNTSIGAAKNQMASKLLEMQRKTAEKDRKEAYFFGENFEIFKRIIKSLFPNPARYTIKDFLEEIKFIFEENDEESITLCTIHKAKGLERKVVYILNEDLIPSKFATTEMQLKQEKNLKYVARSRAIEELYFLNVPSMNPEVINATFN